MQLIANNLSFKNKEFMRAVMSGDMAAVAAMALELKEAGADIININLSLDGEGDERYMPAVVEAVQLARLPISVDSRNPAAHLAALGVANVPVTINYVSGEESQKAEMDEILKVASDAHADLVLYAIKKGTPADADERLAIISDLIERANRAGVPNAHLIVDPVILHIGGGIGQDQAVAVQDTLYGLREMVEPSIRTTCWLSNVSAGAPSELRFAINDTFLSMLAGLGLWSAYVDVLNRETMRTVRLIRALKNEAVYSLADAAL